MVNPELARNFNFQKDNFMARISFDDLLSIGAHFGHVVRKWNPNFQPYVLMEKNGVHIINLEETLKNIERALHFITDVISRNGEILFVGTKKQAKDIIQQEADRCGMFYVVERWLGGTLTNFSTIKKSIKRLQLLEKEGSSIYENLTKKELQMLNRERIKLSDQHRGIKDMRRLPDAVIIVDAFFESIAIKEANLLEIPVIAIVDSNTDPRKIDYPIPANDDSIRTIQLIISTLTDAVIEARTKDDAVEDIKLDSQQSDPKEDKSKIKEEQLSEETKIETAAEELEVNIEEIDSPTEKTAKKKLVKVKTTKGTDSEEKKTRENKDSQKKPAVIEEKEN
ncbi:MAG TPA: 30S ribosomal protein S2 [Candidatus Marinimicrobia bacterium]|nr:30S ribosomal protein S2 [Candidatus Neomarinimicrobiota bacterium]